MPTGVPIHSTFSVQLEGNTSLHADVVVVIIVASPCIRVGVVEAGVGVVGRVVVGIVVHNLVDVEKIKNAEGCLSIQVRVVIAFRLDLALYFSIILDAPTAARSPVALEFDSSEGLLGLPGFGSCQRPSVARKRSHSYAR